MKINLLIFLLSALFLCGCHKDTSSEASIQVFSVAAFKPDEIGRAPSAAELVAMEAFALSIYNPNSTPAAVDTGELKKMGFQLLMIAKKEVSMDGSLKRVCSQPLPWGREPKGLDIVLKPVQGGVEVHAESGLRNGLSPSEENFAGLGRIGTHVFDDGLVITWVTKPLATKN